VGHLRETFFDLRERSSRHLQIKEQAPRKAVAGAAMHAAQPQLIRLQEEIKAKGYSLYS
jgi:hypothetical protein